MPTHTTRILLDPRKPNSFKLKTPRVHYLKRVRQFWICCPKKENTILRCDIRNRQLTNCVGIVNVIRRTTISPCPLFTTLGTFLHRPILKTPRRVSKYCLEFAFGKRSKCWIFRNEESSPTLVHT